MYLPVSRNFYEKKESLMINMLEYGEYNYIIGKVFNISKSENTKDSKRTNEFIVRGMKRHGGINCII